MNKYYHQSMRQIAAIAILCILVVPTVVSNINTYAQTRRDPRRTPLPDQYQEYIYNLNQFYNDRKTYESDKSKYIAYKTVKSREDVLNSSKIMLESARITLLRYCELIETNLLIQEDFNSRVKNALLNDVNIHKTFLTDSEKTISDIQTLEQATITSNAMQLRYTYIRATVTQSLTYIDAVKAKQDNDRARQIAQDFKSIVAGFPSDNKNREIVDKWTEEIVPELANNENLLNELVETMYPVDIKSDKPIYEKPQPVNTGNLKTVTTRQRGYAQKFKEIYQIAIDAYKEL